MYPGKFKIYKEKVVAAFLKKSEQADASWLLDLSRRKIRDYCIERIEIGVHPDDHRALSDFLKMKAGDYDYLTAILATDADDFQALSMFLKEPTKNPAITAVEWVSWLIDFPTRPYAKYIKTELIKPGAEKDKLVTGEAVHGQRDTSDLRPEKERVGEYPPPTTFKEKISVSPPGTTPARNLLETSTNITAKRWYIGIAALAMISITYWFYRKPVKCMYWQDNQYVATSCDVPLGNTPLIALDRARLEGFKRIDQIDTLTTYSVGKLYWVSVNGQIEIYTAGGIHPLYPNKELRKVSDYVINVINNRKSKK